MASTTSFRTYGDRQTAMNLKYLSDRLLDRVKQEMSWQNIPHLKRSFIVQPCALSPLGAEVVISSCYGVNNVHVYVPEAPVYPQIIEPEVIKKPYLHMKIYPDQETERTGYSLVWDIENNRFATEFGISGIVPTSQLGQFLNQTQNDSRPLFEVEDDVLFNDLLQHREVKWSDSEEAHYHVPVLLEHASADEEIPDYTLFLEESGGVVTDSEIYAEMTFTLDSTCLIECDCGGGELEFMECIKALYAGDPPTPEWITALGAASALEMSDQLLTHHEYDIFTTTWDGISNDANRNSEAGTKKYDGTPAKVRAITVMPSELKSSTTNTATLNEIDSRTDLPNRASVYENHADYTNTVIVDRCHYLSAYFFFQDYLFFEYNTQSPPLHDCIKAPLLPSFTVKTIGERPDAEFNVKVTYIADHDENRYAGGIARDPQVGWDGEYGWFHYIDNPTSYPGNELDALYYQTFELFTPIGSIGTISCKHETYQNFTWCGDWRGKAQDYHGIDSIEEQVLNLRFFFGRPTYLGCTAREAIAQVYAYDFNYHDVTAFQAIDGFGTKIPRDIYNPNHENTLRGTSSSTYSTVLGSMVKGNRQLIVGASASLNSGKALTDMERNPLLEQAVKDLFDTYYAENTLPLTEVDEDYKVELEIVTMTREREA